VLEAGFLMRDANSQYIARSSKEEKEGKENTISYVLRNSEANLYRRT